MKKVCYEHKKRKLVLFDKKEKTMKFKNFEKFDLFFFVATVILILIFAVFAKAQSIEIQAPEIAASGGAFTLEKAVITRGASAKEGAAFSEHGTFGSANNP